MTSPLHPLLKRHLEEARKDILSQIDGLKIALAQADEVLKPVVKRPQQPPAATPPPQEQDKPSLDDAAREATRELMEA